MKKVNKVLCIIISTMFLVNSAAFGEVKPKPMNLAAESRLAPMNTPEFLDIVQLTARILLLPDFKSEVFTERNRVETLTSARDGITDRTGTTDVERRGNRLVFYFRDKQILDNKKTVLIPCSVQDGRFNKKDENAPRWYIACVRSLGDDKIDCSCIKPRDCNVTSFDSKSINTILSDPNTCELLAKKQMLPKDKESIARFVEQQNEKDEIIADAIWDQREKRIDAKSNDILTIENFLKHLQNNRLLKEFTRLVKNRQVMEIPGLKKPHAGGVGIYLVNESDFKKNHRDQIVHALFAKCGLFHEENDLMVQVFNEWVLEATVVGEGSPWKYRVHDLNEGYIEKKLTERGNKELFEKAKNASFENRWKDPHSIDYYGDNQKEFLTTRVKKLLKKKVRPGKSKKIDVSTLQKFGINVLPTESREIINTFYEICGSEDSKFLVQTCNDPNCLGIKVYNYGSAGREKRKKMKEFLESKIPEMGKVETVSFETLIKETGAMYKEILYLLPELCKGQLFRTVRYIGEDGIQIAQSARTYPDAADIVKKGIMLDKKNRWKRELTTALEKPLIKERAGEYLKKTIKCGQERAIFSKDWQDGTESLNWFASLNLLYSLCSELSSEYRIVSFRGQETAPYYGGSSSYYVIYRYSAEEYAEVKEKKEIIQNFLEQKFKSVLSEAKGSLLIKLKEFETTDGRSKHLTRKDIAELLPEVCFMTGSKFVLKNLSISSGEVRINNYAPSVKTREKLSTSQKVTKKTTWQKDLRKTLGVTSPKRNQPELPVDEPIKKQKRIIKNLSSYEDPDEVTTIDTASRTIKAILSVRDESPVFFMPQELTNRERCEALTEEYAGAKFVPFNQHDADDLDMQLGKYGARRKVVVTIGAEYENVKDIYEKHENLMPLNFSRQNIEDTLSLSARDYRRKELEKTVISIALLTGALPAEGYASTCSFFTLISLLDQVMLENTIAEDYIEGLIDFAAGDSEKLSFLIRTQLRPMDPYDVEELKFIVNTLISA
ncbi:MAG: hypothetical protein ISS33_05270 [Candidatus Omnitrophica bacterium]|nr:hypothetical protein [Candidatus Omnitrophota bacterium]